MRREWIEMTPPKSETETLQSPSMRREWIEIPKQTAAIYAGVASPSMRREWIEIAVAVVIESAENVSLHAEGVD